MFYTYVFDTETIWKFICDVIVNGMVNQDYYIKAKTIDTVAAKERMEKKEKQLTPEITERAAVLANLKKQIATAKVNAQRAATIKAQEKIKESD